jgi:hypothetical protein
VPILVGTFLFGTSKAVTFSYGNRDGGKSALEGNAGWGRGSYLMPRMIVEICRRCRWGEQGNGDGYEGQSKWQSRKVLTAIASPLTSLIIAVHTITVLNFNRLFHFLMYYCGIAQPTDTNIFFLLL